MPGAPTPVEQQLLARFQNIEHRLQALERSQQLVFTDPPSVYGQGDPAHGYAITVVGNLLPICGISAIGAAVYSAGVWQHITS